MHGLRYNSKRVGKVYILTLFCFSLPDVHMISESINSDMNVISESIKSDVQVISESFDLYKFSLLYTLLITV